MTPFSAADTPTGRFLAETQGFEPWRELNTP